ncbi:chloromuconate cycloisomerase YkfB1 [Cystobacter fuscus DSM 2262]|uniref:Chloromuconate cycloisomerase YkfB1 n=1 Tax=Cystobacter fuscus (strain ATCC 25194 / DSM 2262 / NBRC 100088 / M29) TaxID=1242864 RepID=S9Q1Q9_CYSF2|nr:chloromuconate cycloisomerase YkfB1 [Cystobacter fuscus]EPX55229.1 chloromuconate cycloisomerase YkfB1 [Cystobacter fuscus DSM 2262]
MQLQREEEGLRPAELAERTGVTRDDRVAGRAGEGGPHPAPGPCRGRTHVGDVREGVEGGGGLSREMLDLEELHAPA